MKVKQTFMIGLFVTSFLTSCDQHPSFSNSTEAVNGCHEVLAELQGKKEVDNEELTKLSGLKLRIQLIAFSARILLLHSEVLLPWLTSWYQTPSDTRLQDWLFPSLVR